MRGLNHQLKQLCRHNREGSFGTQVQRERELTLMANQLHEIGFRSMNSHSLKPKHVEALVKHWLESDVAAGTIKNRMAAFRWCWLFPWRYASCRSGKRGRQSRRHINPSRL